MNKIYDSFRVTDEGVEKIMQLREGFSTLHDLIEACAPSSRERSVALTHLETAAMFANKAIAVANQLECCDTTTAPCSTEPVCNEAPAACCSTPECCPAA